MWNITLTWPYLLSYTYYRSPPPLAAAAASVAASATVGAAAAAVSAAAVFVDAVAATAVLGPRRRHDRHLRCYRCGFLVDCCLPPPLPQFPPAAAVLACPCRCHRCCLPAPLTMLPPLQPPPLFLPPHRCHRCLFFYHRHHCLYVSTFPTASMLQRFSRRGCRCLCFDRHHRHSFRQDYH